MSGDLPDKIRLAGRFLFREAVLRPPEGNALDQEGHIAGQGAHRLQALLIAGSFSGRCSVDAVPVLTGGDRHAGDRKIFVQLVIGCGQAAAAGHRYAGAYLHGFVKGGAVEEPVKERDQRAVGGSVVDGAGDNQAVALFKDGGRLIDRVVKSAFSVLFAGSAGNAAADCPGPETDRLCLHALREEDPFHLLQGDRRVALLMRAAVYHQDFHGYDSFLFAGFMRRPVLQTYYSTVLLFLFTK